MNSPLVYIIILNWNGLQDTLECLGSVFKMDYLNFKVVVVDNASNDDSVEIIRTAYPAVTLMENKDNLGYAGGNNIAMCYSMQQGADYMWLLNNDTIVEADTLSTIVSAAEKSESIGLVSPISYYYDDPERVEICGRYIESGKSTFPSFRDFKDVSQWQQVYKKQLITLWGTALLIKRRLVDEIGYLDEKFFAYWEDTDYSLRADKADYQNLVCTSAKIYHKYPLPEASKTRGMHYFYFMSRNRFFFITKHFNRSRFSVLRNHLAHVLGVMAYNSHNTSAVEGSLDGLWAALYGVSGRWNKEFKMPAWLRLLFYPFIFCCPGIWISLLNGHFPFTPSKVIKRLKVRYKVFL